MAKKATAKKEPEPKKPVGRPTKYTLAIAQEICERIAAGEAVKAIGRDARLPNEGTILSWVIDDREGFSTLYARAREIQAERFADELAEIADDGSNDWMERANARGEIKIVLDREHVSRSQLRVDTRKWIMSRLLAKKYGPPRSDDDKETGEVTIKIVGGLPE